MFILRFSMTILLWPLNTWGLMYNTKIKKKLMTRITMELKGIIWSYNFNCSLKLSGNKLPKLLKCRQSLRFVRDKYIHVVRVQSSTRVKKYLNPLCLGTLYGPKMSMWYGGTFAITNVIREPCKFRHGTCHTSFIVLHLKFQLWQTL